MIAEPHPVRPGEQLLLMVGEQIWAWGIGSTFIEAFVKAVDQAVQTGLPVHLYGRVRMNDYVGSPIWGDYIEYPLPEVRS